MPKNKITRWLSMFLSIIMIMSSISTPVYAYGADDDKTVIDDKKDITTATGDEESKIVDNTKPSIIDEIKTDTDEKGIGEDDKNIIVIDKDDDLEEEITEEEESTEEIGIDGKG